MDDKFVRPKVVLERKGLSYTRSIRKKVEKRSQRHRSKSLPTIAITVPVPEKAFPSRQTYTKTLSEESSNSSVTTDEDEFGTGRIRQFSTTMKGLINKGDLYKDGRRDSGCSASSFRRMSSASISSGCSSYGRRDSLLSESQHRRNSSFATSFGTPIRRTSCITDGEYKRLSYGQRTGISSSDESILDEFPSEYKVLVIGATGVGKSAIICQFTTSEFIGSSDAITGM